MIDLERQFKSALKVHQSGDLAQAKILYETILKQDPRHADTMHLLGVLFAQLGQFQVSTHWIQQAIAIKPDIPVFHNNYGNALKALGDLDSAIEQYRQALQLKPDYAEVHNNLASVLYKQNNLPDALKHYATAIRLQPDYLEAHVNLGLLFLRQNQIDAAIKQFTNVLSLQPDFAQAHWQLGTLYLARDELDKAIEHYRSLLQQNPEHIEALNNLGVVYLKQNKFNDAIEMFQKVLSVEPKHKDARSNLATVLLQQDRFTEAGWHYQLYLQLVPDDSEAHYNSAVAAMALGNTEEAIYHFQRTLELTPQHGDAQSNLAAIYLKKGNKELAINYYQQALKLQPNNAAIIYMLDALEKKHVPSGAPAEYIKNLFDNYAGYFDKQLTENLHYQTPILMRTALKKIMPATDEKYVVLDLGCGTGLSGVEFRDLAKHLTGVDLSPRMLEKAKEKNIYDELFEASILDFLANTSAQFDLIIAADTLVYFGDLSAVFAGCFRSLRHKGFFVFSTELGVGENYELQTSGRYSHSKSYIQKLATEHSFTLLEVQEVIGRYQQEQPVQNVIYILQRQP